MSSGTLRQLGTFEATWSSRTARIFEAHDRQIVAILLICLFAAAITLDIRVPLRTDELLTLYVTRQPSIPDVLDAIRDGVDSQPPLYDFIVRTLNPLIASDALRVRLPSTLGFFLMCICVFAFVRKRLPATYAILAMFVAARTTWIYAFEGRSYGLVLGCVSMALVCWQAAAEPGRRRAVVGLCISLAAAIALHYLSVFVLCALIAGELVRWWSSRRLDLPILVALAVPPLVLVPHLPLIRAGRPFIQYFWSKASVGTLYAFYLPMIVSLALVFVFALICSLWFRVNRREECRKAESGLPTHEWVVGLILMLLPEVVILASLLTIKMFVDRYVLWSMIGAGIFLTSALHRTVDGNRAIAMIVTLPLLIWSGGTMASAFTERPAFRYAGDLPQELRSVPREPRPVVITGVHAFMELWFYSEPGLRDRLVYLVDPELEKYYLHTDTTSRILSALRQRMPLGVADYDSFIAANPTFILAGEPVDWISLQLHRLNYRFVPLGGGANSKMYEVKPPLDNTSIGETPPVARKKLP